MPNDARLTASRPALIEGGTIIEVHGDAGLGVLFYDEPALFQDFELRLQWKAFHGAGHCGRGRELRDLPARAAAGPGRSTTPTSTGRRSRSRSTTPATTPAPAGFRSPLHRTGAVYGIAPACRRAEKVASTDGTPGFWNDCRVVATGSRIAVTLNGRTVSEGELPSHLVQPGMIALQYHSGKVQFRAIRIRRL